MSERSDVEIAPCLNGSEIAQNARSLITASRTLGSSAWASVLRAWCVPLLFQDLERIFASGEEPIAAINRSMGVLTEMLYAAERVGLKELRSSSSAPGTHASASDLEEVTGEHYGRLFSAFGSKSYWEEPAKLLWDRLDRNGLSTMKLSDKEVLDAGCGGGRYTVAWKLLGAKSATGCDISGTGLTDAQRRVQQAGIRGVEFEQGNVLDLPFSADRFDIVFSNGVLHHTINWTQGVEELVRVLKPDGLGWLYLIENPGGLFWDMIEILRVIMKDESHHTARNALRIIGMPANRIFYMLDHVMVPINMRLTPQEIEECLATAGATEIRRLERGTAFDRIEHIYQKKLYASVHFGIGENRYVFSKN